jgi:hypothetical protein
MRAFSLRLASFCAGQTARSVRLCRADVAQRVCYDSRGARLPTPLAGCRTNSARHSAWPAPPAPLSGWPALLISLVVLGILASLDPLRPAVFVVVLRSQFGNAIAFLAGWTLALSLLFVLVLVTFAGDISDGPDARHRTAASVVLIAVGVVLLGVAGHRWRRRHDERGPAGYPQAVLRRLHHLDVRRSAALGVLIQPRALTIAAAAVVARDRAGVLSLLIGFAVFAVASTAALLGILIYVIRRPETATLWLTDVVSAIERQCSTIFTVLCAAGGGYLVLDGLANLLG